MRAHLVLADGTVFWGQLIPPAEPQGQGAKSPAFSPWARTYGEVVFNTAMTGYQEMLTDPSYRGQILVLTFPLIGNYGATEEDTESLRIQAKALVVREICLSPSNWRLEEGLDEFTKRFGVPILHQVDTRALVRRLRVHGVMMGAIAPGEKWRETLEWLLSQPRYEEMDFVKEVTTAKVYQWTRGGPTTRTLQWEVPVGRRFRVVVVDCGLKFNILRELYQRGCEVTAVPATWAAEDILSLKPDGVLYSPGPGNPAMLDYIVREIRKVLGKKPVMGICLGHQLLSRALGASTYKLKFGHRGANHPVKDLRTERVYITSQNHGYAVDAESLEAGGAEVTHINLNDGSVEGMRHKWLPVFGVQYHPEASPGPRDSGYLFDEFVKMMEVGG